MDDVENCPSNLRLIHSRLCIAHFVGGVKDKKRNQLYFHGIKKICFSTKEKHSDSMTCYTDGEVPIKDGGDDESSEMSSITEDGNGRLEKGSPVDDINDTMASSNTMEASSSVTSVQKHLADKEVQVTHMYDTRFVNALLVHINDLENSNASITKVSIIKLDT